MPQQQNAIIATATRSEVENVPDIQSLIDRSQALSQKVDWWNTAMLWALAFAAIAAIAVGIATWKVVTTAKQLGDVQDELTLTLRGKVATLEITAGSTAKDLLALQKAADDAKAAQQKVEIELAKQRERAAKAETALLEVQERMKPRNLTAAQQQELIAELKPFSGQAIDIFVLNDAGDEIGHISEQIVSVLKESGWIFKVGNGSETGISRSGIVITPFDNADAGSREALSVLESALRSKGLGVNKPNATTVTTKGHTWRMGTNTTTTAPIQMVIARK